MGDFDREVSSQSWIEIGAGLISEEELLEPTRVATTLKSYGRRLWTSESSCRNRRFMGAFIGDSGLIFELISREIERVFPKRSA